MSRIAELERRIVQALDRIGRGASQLEARGSSGTDDGAELATLRKALEKEKAANAQLSERVNSVRQRQETSVAQMERRLARLTEQLDLQSLEMLRLKKANTKLMEANAALREAQMAGAPDSTVLNRSLSAELEALKAERRAEMAEMEEILSELQPLVAREESHV